MLNGLSVGMVSKIEIMNDAERKLKVVFDVDNHITVGDSAVAIIASNGLLGGKSIVLNPGNFGKPVKPNSQIAGEVEKDVTEKLTEKLSPIIENLNITIGNLNKLTNDENLLIVKSILKNIDNTIKGVNAMLDRNTPVMNSTLDNIKTISASLIEQQKKLDVLLSKANVFTDSLNKMQLAAAVNNTNKSVIELHTMLQTINKGDGTMGKLVKDDSLYTNLNKVAADLDKLLVDLRQRPKRYVHFSLFGKKDK
jgi:phospholipid/cholesterol/gamma-HCH transport system substrate-binding protein